ncbi:MAG: hypothetical protein CMO66_04985 [Verrucomicrobiales bacterium]|nr:hypothetical protein [Verrucomicrobiales bacterium]
MQIAPLIQYPDCLETAIDWVEGEWGGARGEVSEMLLESTQCPPALVALEGEIPVGLLAFKVHEFQPAVRDELWINALYVVPEFRGQGIAHRLVKAAKGSAREANRQALFVYTDIPGFYEQLGWKQFSFNEASGMHVLAHELIQPAAAGCS